MAGNILPDKSGDILVEFDYDNIIVVDPNRTIDGDGNINERLVDPENLVMYANLEAELLPRTKLALGASPDQAVTTISIASINFLKGNNDQYFTTGYYDELTGKNTTEGLGQNQTQNTYTQRPGSNRPIVESATLTGGNAGAVSNGLLGITSINIRINTSFIPTVTIELEDVQGRALFQLGQDSPYAAFFNLPYPPFYLTLKGYYGQAVRYQLNLIKFNARFNSFSGNYQVTIELQGYKFNILNEIAMGHLVAAPHMYSSNFTIGQATNNQSFDKSVAESATVQGEKTASNLSGNDIKLTQVVTEKGYQKIRDVYSEYKAKRLIPPDFPELTLQQLMNKLEIFEKQVLDSYVKADVKPLTNIRDYREKLKQFFDRLYLSNNSWFSTWCDTEPFVTNDDQVYYAFKETVRQNDQQIELVITELKQIITEFKIALNANETLGLRSKSQVKFKISEDTIIKNNVSSLTFDKQKTLVRRYNRATGLISETAAIDKQISIFTSLQAETNPLNNKTKYKTSSTFVYLEEFINQIRIMETEVNRKLGVYESAITTDLANKIQSKTLGIGFKPSIRNVMAVIMASAEGFIRLLDEVHTNSWNVRFDPDRKNAVLKNPSSAQSSDSKFSVPASERTLLNNPQLKNSQIPVYPWPQFFVETNDDKSRFQLKYVADPSVVDDTKAWDYTKWPEVEFVEEYMKGLTQKFNPPVAQEPLDSSKYTNIVNINALEFPEFSLAYANREEVKFFYEIWERQFVTAHYTGLFRADNPQFDKLLDGVLDFESKNIVSSIGISNPYLAFKLKNYELNAKIYPGFLRSISNNGTGRFYQEYIRDFFVTPYLKGFLETPTSILKVDELGSIPQLSEINVSENIKSVIDRVSNEPTVVDTYPFTDIKWCSTNLVGFQYNSDVSRYNTNKVITIFEQRNVISNFTDIDSFVRNRPVTNFSYLNSQDKSVGLNSFTNLSEIYVNSEPTEFMPTEGYVSANAPSLNYFGRDIVNTTTSMLNTPYFINAIQKGVDQWRRNAKNPYKAAAYLFLNSLPLITLRERVKSQYLISDDNTPAGQQTPAGLNDFDFFFATIKKFGAVHKLPYAWILRAGSLWHRYKLHKETGVDFIDDVWKRFDAVTNYDPVTKSSNKVYSYIVNGEENKIVLQDQTTESINMNVGFYPKVITDFNVFYNGYDVFKQYTNEELQDAVNNGLKIWDYQGSRLSNISQGSTLLTLNTKSIIIPANIQVTITEENCKVPVIQNIENNYILPSFGSQVNEVRSALIEQIGTDNPFVVPGYSISGNDAVFNGSVRMFWNSPNYGYFNSSEIVKPSTDSYMTKVQTDAKLMSPFRLMNKDEYTKIDDMISVFDRKTLDLFEDEFLKFSNSVNDIQSGDLISAPFNKFVSDTNAQYKNFQYFMRNLMKVPPKQADESEEFYFQNIGQQQYGIIQKQIQNFLQFDILLRVGNPSEYNRRVFNSYLSHDSATISVVNPIKFDPYIKNTLPSMGGTITLSQSKQLYPKEWLALELNVGFSTIPELEYKNSGSYITDFFIDNDIKFSVDNIEILSPLIKMYATQKLDTTDTTPNSFKTKINQFLDKTKKTQDYFIDGIINRLQGPESDGGLPNYSEVSEKKINSVLDGQQSKVENWEVFKALNDKWIAGGDYNNKTLFEDMLFLDRASRNIGDTLLIDIFDLKNAINKTILGSAIQNKMSVYTFISSILIDNNFTIMNLPAYVNFYNVTNVDGTNTFRPEGSLDFANNMWGTFLNVDYRNSSPKMVCFYAGKPSNYVALPENKTYMFKDDGFDLRRASENPLIENLTNKTDWGLSNRCVGFNVDIGIRNQNIFYGFSVGQENGKATSEAIQSQLNMINQINGQNTSTQNVSLYNLYKQRSYTCTVTSLGNALIQPTMYFNLRHVPMFYGPYMITDVIQTITPGSFQTQFTGVRQGIFDLPTIDKYLQSINQNLLTKLEKFVLNKADSIVPPKTNYQSQADQKSKETDSRKQPPNACDNSVLPIYKEKGFVATSAQEVKLTRKEMSDLINSELSRRQGTPDITLQATMYSICYFSTFKTEGQVFIGFNNCYATQYALSSSFSTFETFFTKTYCCMKNEGLSGSYPLPNFNSASDFIKFLFSRLEKNADRIKKLGLWKFYSCHFPTDKIVSEEEFDKNKNTNVSFKNIRDVLNKALTDAKGVGIDVGDINLFLDGPTPPSQPQQTATVQPLCPEPEINSFEPFSAYTSSPSPEITIYGTSLYGNTQVFIGNQPCNIIENTETKIVFVPTQKVGGKIKVITEYGQDETQSQFQFIFRN
jgi:hypothetical protein